MWILKKVAPITISLLKSSKTQAGTSYWGFTINFAYMLSLVMAEIPKDLYLTSWDELSVSPYEITKSQHKAVAVLVKKPPILTKACAPKLIVMFNDDEDDYEGRSGDETVIMVTPS
ncbi:uncharacterized protein ARMOST_03422 [Armillaria ostoyae]|uniref:Uncharacterized protein n=1 Tax=Armillaria ostoyae TaxID=47428 RepID=A0A284QUF1_ARMOS|nr:uncharacterized protein ARMOST_03422 [Armillaria ostoyae]